MMAALKGSLCQADSMLQCARSVASYLWSYLTALDTQMGILQHARLHGLMNLHLQRDSSMPVGSI